MAMGVWLVAILVRLILASAANTAEQNRKRQSRAKMVFLKRNVNSIVISVMPPSFRAIPLPVP